jgi:hypothetical protein
MARAKGSKNSGYKSSVTAGQGKQGIHGSSKMLSKESASGAKAANKQLDSSKKMSKGKGCV